MTGRRFVGANLDWSGLPEVHDVERRAVQWLAYSRGEELPSGSVKLFEDFIGAMIEAGHVKPIGPGLARKLKNFGFAVTKDVKTGSRRVPESVRAERITICRSCPLYNKAKGWCKHPDCGCLMTRKVRWASTECPVGHWGEHFETGEDDGDD